MRDAKFSADAAIAAQRDPKARILAFSAVAQVLRKELSAWLRKACATRASS